MAAHAMLCTAAASLVHASFSATHARALIQHWNPKPVHLGDDVHFLPGAGAKLRVFARAAILLNDGHGAFASLDGSHFNLYIHRDGKIILCLWAIDEARRDLALARLRDWYAQVFPDRPPLAAELLGEDAEMWTRGG